MQRIRVSGFENRKLVIFHNLVATLFFASGLVFSFTNAVSIPVIRDGDKENATY